MENQFEKFIPFLPLPTFLLFPVVVFLMSSGWSNSFDAGAFISAKAGMPIYALMLISLLVTVWAAGMAAKPGALPNMKILQFTSATMPMVLGLMLVILNSNAMLFPPFWAASALFYAYAFVRHREAKAQ